MSKVLISMPDELLAQIEAAAKSEHMKKSEWIRKASLMCLKGGTEPANRTPTNWTPMDDPDIRRAYETIVKADLKSPDGKTAEEAVREMRDSR